MVNQMNESIMLKWVLYYYDLGLAIIPVKAKTPLVRWKEYQTIRATKEQLIEWWDQWPDADIGCITGKITGRLVLDIDGPEGAESVKGLDIPKTPSVRTRRGVQYHFAWPTVDIDKTTLAGVLKGVDCRGIGGYVKLPPSKCTDGTLYEWFPDRGIHEVLLAPAPQWLIDKLSEKRTQISDTSYSQKTEDHWLSDTLEGVGLGERHEALLKVSGYYFNCMHPDVALQHIREWNKKNNPPIPDNELDEQLTDLQKRFQNGEYDSKYLLEAKSFKLITAEEVVTNYAGRIDYLVEGLIPIGTSLIFGGWQGLGKTFVATDLVIEIARKKGSGRWLDSFTTKHGPVIYIDNEMGGNLTSYRLKQLLGPKGLTPNDLDLRYSIRNRIKFTNEKHYSKLIKEISAIRPVLVIMDSFASCHTLDENQSKDMRHFFDDLIAPICDQYKCTVMLVDHEGKGIAGIHQQGSKRLRGSGAKGDAVDSMISLDWQNGDLLFEHSKPRYQKKHDPFKIEIQDVSGGIKVVNVGYVPMETK
jgi:archaellum biogenesis ATPase FlaH